MSSKILAIQNPKFKILFYCKIFADFRILAFQNDGFQILAVFRILAFQYPEFMMLADFKILPFQNNELKILDDFKILARFKILAFLNPE